MPPHQPRVGHHPRAPNCRALAFSHLQTPACAMGAATWAVQLDLVDAPVVQQWLFSFFAVSSATIGLGAHHTALPASLPAGQQPGIPSPPPPPPPTHFRPRPLRCLHCKFSRRAVQEQQTRSATAAIVSLCRLWPLSPAHPARVHCLDCYDVHGGGPLHRCTAALLYSSSATRMKSGKPLAWSKQEHRSG